MRISQKLQCQILAHAESVYPSEACGVLLKTDSGREYVPLWQPGGQ